MLKIIAIVEEFAYSNPKEREEGLKNLTGFARVIYKCRTTYYYSLPDMNEVERYEMVKLVRYIVRNNETLIIYNGNAKDYIKSFFTGKERDDLKFKTVDEFLKEINDYVKGLRD